MSCRAPQPSQPAEPHDIGECGTTCTTIFMHLVTLPSSEALGDRDESVESGTAAPNVGLRVVHRQDGSTGTDQPLLLPDLQLCSNLTYKFQPHLLIWQGCSPCTCMYLQFVLYSLMHNNCHTYFYGNFLQLLLYMYLFGRHWRSPCFDRCTQWPSNELPTLLSDSVAAPCELTNLCTQSPAL